MEEQEPKKAGVTKDRAMANEPATATNNGEVVATTVMDAYERNREGLTRVTAHNKEVVFDALSAAGITSVTVSFDGEGDSGQMDDITAYVGDGRRDLPDVQVDVVKAAGDSDTLHRAQASLRDAVVDLCYAVLEEEQGGWEINEGAYGEFTFSVAERRIDLDFNARYLDVTTSHYQF